MSAMFVPSPGAEQRRVLARLEHVGVAGQRVVAGARAASISLTDRLVEEPDRVLLAQGEERALALRRAGGSRTRGRTGRCRRGRGSAAAPCRESRPRGQVLDRSATPPSKTAALMPMSASSVEERHRVGDRRQAGRARGDRARRRPSAAASAAVGAGGDRGTVERAEHDDLGARRPRTPRTSTRTAPTSPSGCGLRSIGRWAVKRSRRLAARRAVTRSTPGKAGTSSERVGQLGPVAVLGADRVGEPAQLAARAGRAARCQSPSRQSSAVAGQGAVVLARRRPVRRCRCGPRGSRRPSSKLAAAWRASTQEYPGENPAPDHHRDARRACASASRASSALDVVDRVAGGDDAAGPRRRGRAPAPRGCRTGRPGGRRRRRRRARRRRRPPWRPQLSTTAAAGRGRRRRRPPRRPRRPRRAAGPARAPTRARPRRRGRALTGGRGRRAPASRRPGAACRRSRGAAARRRSARRSRGPRALGAAGPSGVSSEGFGGGGNAIEPAILAGMRRPPAARRAAPLVRGSRDRRRSRWDRCRSR